MAATLVVSSVGSRGRVIELPSLSVWPAAKMTEPVERHAHVVGPEPELDDVLVISGPRLAEGLRPVLQSSVQSKCELCTELGMTGDAVPVSH